MESTEASAWEEASRATLADYAAVAEEYAAGNLDHDVSQNINALLTPLLAEKEAPLDILDVCSASGRDLVTFTKLGHKAVGLDGVAEFCEMSRTRSGCEVWQQNLIKLELPPQMFDGIFCNACLFHVRRLQHALVVRLYFFLRFHLELCQLLYGRFAPH